MAAPRDPFRADRRDDWATIIDAEGRAMPLVLRLKELRRVCKDTATYSNDDPFMIVPHSEADVRSVRQYPIETDPPEHTEYRALVEPMFRKPDLPAYQAGMRAMVAGVVAEAVGRGEVEVVREVSLVIQSRGLARLLGVGDAEADRWIGWGTHVFKQGDGRAKGDELHRYIERKYREAQGSDGEDMFSVLNRAEFQGRPLTHEEKLGFANMAFAGGRDTVIHTLSSIVAYLGDHPEALDFLRADPARILSATEEFVRFVSPLTVIARRCPHGGAVHGTEVEPGGRIGLCWPSANRDESGFQDPDSVVLDRKPNPHVGFGFGVHKCLGAPQARLIIRCLLRALCEQVERVEILAATPEIERESSYERQVGYAELRARLRAKASITHDRKSAFAGAASYKRNPS